MSEPLSSGKKVNPYQHKRHGFYGEAWITDAIDALAKLNKQENRMGRTRSEIIAISAKKVLRANANRLRKAGHILPDELFPDRKA